MRSQGYFQGINYLFYFFFQPFFQCFSSPSGRRAQPHLHLSQQNRVKVDLDPTLTLFGLSGSCLLEAGEVVGLRTAAEVFADRSYASDGSLVPRDEPGAVVDDPRTVVEQALQIVQAGTVTASDGDTIALTGDTLCLHGDTPGAGELAARLRKGLEDAGIRVLPIAIGEEGR